ncbi:CcdC protein domain-containing protein [Streptomyces sp. I05A-00742]|uniref:CcdC protein domain-containing protein n=1 Tax=Streptomyces sp. I05A-00742 TaxID=2732853 RepID=UPI00148948A9|nr:CcdC protein domain-containing protein [Streptomyces sp. I05A-00742]
MNGWLLAGIIAVVLIVVVVKRLRGEPLNARDLAVPPVVLVTIGVVTLAKAEEVTSADLAWVVPGAVLGAALGAVRARTVRLFEKDGVLWQRYTGRTFLVLAGSLVVMAAYGFVATKAGLHEEARPTQLNVGVSFLGESLVLGFRGLRSGVPFAPEKQRW